MRSSRAGGIVLAACLGVSGAGCGLLLGVSSWQDVACVDSCGADGSADGPLGHDSTTDSSEAGQGDSNQTDTSPVGDSSPDALDSGTSPEADAADPYHPINDTSFWTTFDVSTLDAGPKGFLGGAFDGRYVYLAPHGVTGAPSGVVTRLDTQVDGGFGTRAAWQTFDTASIDGGAGASGYQGAVYDNVHERLYLVPDNDGVPDGIVAMYPTGNVGDAGVLPFSKETSWSTYAPVVGDAGALAGFAGGTFDGQYLYLVPSNNGAADGVAARLDTTLPFASPSSWSSYDMTKTPGGTHAVSYLGAVYTGALVLFAPTEYPFGGSTKPSGVVVDYAPGAQPFASGTWEILDLTGIVGGGSSGGFRGVAWDGRYAYFVPNASGSQHAEVARYDSTFSFTDNNGWSFFDATQQLINAGATGFFGGAFDGRYIYLVPNANSVLVRYDTASSAFTAASSWSTFDMTPLAAGKGPFAGAVFDGEFLYFVPQTSGVVTRFDARSPPMSVSGQTGSFF